MNGVNFLLLGDYRRVYQETVKKLTKAFPKRLKVLGYLSHENALRLYSKSHAVLFPSVCEEPLPYVVIESMLMGTLLVASRVGGIARSDLSTDTPLHEPRFILAGLTLTRQ